VGAHKALASSEQLQKLLVWTEAERKKNLTRVEKLAETHSRKFEKALDDAKKKGDCSATAPVKLLPRSGTRVKSVADQTNAFRGEEGAQAQPEKPQQTKHPSDWTPKELARWLTSKDGGCKMYERAIIKGKVLLEDLDEEGLKGLVEDESKREQVRGYIAALLAQQESGTAARTGAQARA
jgi:hypothetical protein